MSRWNNWCYHEYPKSCTPLLADFGGWTCIFCGLLVICGVPDHRQNVIRCAEHEGIYKHALQVADAMVRMK